MVLSALSSAARRSAAPLLRQQQKRQFALGGSHGPPPEWEGVDKVVRGYFPEDYQCMYSLSADAPLFCCLRLTFHLLLVAIAILGAYTGGIVLYKIKSAISGKKAEPEPAKPVETAPVAPASGIPGIESPAFEKFVETDAFAKLLENEEQLKTLLESA